MRFGIGFRIEFEIQKRKVSFFLAGIIFGDIGMSLSVTEPAFGEVGVIQCDLFWGGFGPPLK